MAKKQEKEIERWVTVNGARVPIFKDGSIGGPKALQEAYKKAHAKEKEEDDPIKNNQKLKKQLDDFRKAHPNATGEDRRIIHQMLAEYNARVRADMDRIKKVQTMQKYGVTGARNLSQLRDKLKDYGVGMESADMADIERDSKFMNGEKISLYDKAGNEYRGTFNVYKDGGMEIVNIKKEWHNRKPTDTHPTGVEDDTKEKQTRAGVTRKDVEELTAKKDKLKGTKLDAKPISEKEVEEYKKNNPFKSTDKQTQTKPQDTLKQADRIARAMQKNKMSDKDMEELITQHNGDVDKALRSLDYANKAVSSYKKYTEQIDKDFDTKEKQIARNKAERDKLDNKSENYKKLSKEEKAKTEKYIEDNKWVNKQVNDQLKQGKNYNEVMADVHEAMNSEKQITEKLNQQKAKVLTKKQKGKQAIREAKEALKKYGVSRGAYKDFDKLDDTYKKLSKMYPYEISQEDYETIYNLFKNHGEYNRFFEIHNYRNRKKKK